MSNTYIPGNDVIVHKTQVYFSNRKVSNEITIVQYDNKMVVVEVELMVNNKPYKLPTTVTARIRWGKKDNTFVIKDVLGYNENRDSVYFDIDQQMTIYHGMLDPIIELLYMNGEDVYRIGSSSIPINIKRNPVQLTDIESDTEYIDVDAILLKIQYLENNKLDKNTDITDEDQLYVKLKNGDNVLQDISKLYNNVIFFETYFEFPSIGALDVLYVDKQKNKAYLWNNELSEYYILRDNGDHTIMSSEQPDFNLYNKWFKPLYDDIEILDILTIPEIEIATEPIEKEVEVMGQYSPIDITEKEHEVLLERPPKDTEKEHTILLEETVKIKELVVQEEENKI